MMALSSTDLPVPEPPTTPSTSPRRTSRSSPSWIVWAPNRVTSPRTRITAAWLLQTPTYENRIEKSASSTITRNIPTTTDRVVSRPTLSALPLTFRPS